MTRTGEDEQRARARKAVYNRAYAAKHFTMTPDLMYFGDALRDWLGLEPLWIVEKCRR